MVVATVGLSSPAGAATREAPAMLDSAAPAFTYLGAWGAAWLGVQLAPQGTATFRVRQTSWLKMTVWASGRSFTTTVDGSTLSPTMLPTCECFKTVLVANGLASTQHLVTVSNTDPNRSFGIRTWLAEPAGKFMQYYWAQPSLVRVVKEGSSTSFTVRNAASVAIGYVANGVKVRVAINDRYLAFVFTGPTSGGIAHQVIAWGLTPGLEKITLTAVQGTLDIRSGSLLQAAGRGTPSIVDNTTLASTPLLGVYGDSIPSGLRTLGMVRDSDGFADRLAALRGWRVSHRGLGGASAGCWGKTYVNRIISIHPDIVMVGFGTNDMLPGVDYFGCDDDIDQFKAGIDSILAQLATGLPGVPVYVEAIIPTGKVDETTRAAWNQALQDAAAAHSVPVVDPSALLTPLPDYADPIHPNNRGHQEMADYWNAALAPISLS